MKKNYTLFSVRTFRAGALSEQIREHDLRAITVLSERRASQDASSCSSDMSLCHLSSPKAVHWRFSKMPKWHSQLLRQPSFCVYQAAVRVVT